MLTSYLVNNVYIACLLGDTRGNWVGGPLTHFWILTLNLPLDGCKYFDRLYKEGEVMIPTTSRKCEYLCTCHVYENYEGQFFCERLCQQYTDYICRPGWESKPVNVSAGPPEYGCFCEENHCVPSLGIDALVARLRLRWTSSQVC